MAGRSLKNTLVACLALMLPGAVALPQRPETGQKELAATLVGGVKHRSALLTNVDVCFSYEYLRSADLTETLRKELAAGEYTRVAERLEPYDRSIARLTRFGEKWRGEVRAIELSGISVWDPAAFNWHDPPEAHEVYVLGTFDGGEYTRYSQGRNLVEVSGQPPGFWPPVADWWEKCFQLVSDRTLQAILDAPADRVDVEAPTGTGVWELRSVFPSSATDRPTCRCELSIDQSLGYAVSQYAWTFERDGKLTSGTVVVAKDFGWVTDGIAVPSRVEWHEYEYDEQGEPQWYQSRRYRVRKLRLLTEDEPALFRFSPPLGALVRTETGDERWVGERIEAPFDSVELQLLAAPTADITGELTRLGPTAPDGGGR